MCAPTGPSLILKAGIPSRGKPVEAIMVDPESIWIFSDNVILGMVASIFFSSSADCARTSVAPEIAAKDRIAEKRNMFRENGRGRADFEASCMLPPKENSMILFQRAWARLPDGDSAAIGTDP
jgi:hypothetical protein